jgi:hypothetical protein
LSDRRGRGERGLARQQSSRRWLSTWLVIMIVTVAVVIAAEHTSHGRSIVSSVQEFLLKYMGVFALIGLTAAVGVGLVATDRIVMKPGHRVVAQAVHRGVSLAALVSLAAHIVLEILAHRSHAIDAVVPFLAQRRTLYVGLGTIASDLVVLIVITGFLRGRFAGRWPWAWRTIHAIAYLAWPLSVVHGLLAGRTAKPYVDWSYGACLALVALALAIRFAVTIRPDGEKLAHPVSDRLSVPAEGLIPGTRVSVAPLSPAPLPGAQLPAGGMSRPPLPQRRALQPGSGPSYLEGTVDAGAWDDTRADASPWAGADTRMEADSGAWDGADTRAEASPWAGADTRMEAGPRANSGTWMDAGGRAESGTWASPGSRPDPGPRAGARRRTGSGGLMGSGSGPGPGATPSPSGWMPPVGTPEPDSWQEQDDWTDPTGWTHPRDGWSASVDGAPR